jgi:hypothetical protein
MWMCWHARSKLQAACVVVHTGVALGKVVEHGYELADTLSSRLRASAPAVAAPAAANN